MSLPPDDSDALALRTRAEVGEFDGWRIVRAVGPADDLHRDSAAALESRARQIRLLSASEPALVLGASQSLDDVDNEALKRNRVELARRRSGGSAVLVGPEKVLWIDVIVPAGDPLWQADVSRAARWLGELWAHALGPDAEVWDGAMRHSPWSRAVCFAGLGPGEVTIAGAKVVGISQRRTQRGALFQSAALLAWEPRAYERLLKPPRGATADQLDGVAVGIGAQRGEEVAEAFVRRLAHQDD